MIDFNEKRYLSGMVTDDLDNRELLVICSERVRKDLAEHKENFFYLGVHLVELYNSNLYSLTYDRGHLETVCKLSGYVGDCCAQWFFEYCYTEFGLDKTQVSRYMNIVDEFGDGFRGFKERWREYSYSQLCELLPLTFEQRIVVEPGWTIRRIREYKKSLAGAFSLSDSPKTSDVPPQTKYSRFDGFTRAELCDKILVLENEYSELVEFTDRLKEELSEALKNTVFD